MLYIFRLIITVIYSILVCVFGSIYCLFSPRNPKHVATFGHMFGRLAPLFGLKVECRKPADAESYGNAIYIANHQNNYDMVTASNIVQPPTVTVGKKSLLWIPFFGQLYWLTGNLLIDRNNRTKAHGTIAEVVNHFKKRRISIWMFPIYGMASFLSPICKRLKGKSLVLRGGVYTCCIFIGEYITGSFLRKFEACPWDYSEARLNVNGLIRLDYAPLWFGAGLLFEKILCRR